MKKMIFVFGLLFLFLSLPFSLAESGLDADSPELIKTLREYRAELYEELNLNPAQKKEIEAIDKKLYDDMTPCVVKINFYIQKLKNLAKDEFVTKDEVDAIRKEFDKADKEISEIKAVYEKDFKKILNKNQKVNYKYLKKAKQEELKQELKEKIKKQKQGL